MKKRKTTVFWVINFELVLILILLIFFAKDMLASLGVTVIIMLVGNGATYIGGNVFHAWQKSKYYKADMDGQNRLEVITGELIQGNGEDEK